MRNIVSACVCVLALAAVSGCWAPDAVNPGTPSEANAHGNDAGTNPASDAGTDAGQNPVDGGNPTDSGTTDDAGQAADAGNTADAGQVTDAGQTDDGGTAEDAGQTNDAGVDNDAGVTPDAGQVTDAGNVPNFCDDKTTSFVPEEGTTKCEGFDDQGKKIRDITKAELDQANGGWVIVSGVCSATCDKTPKECAGNYPNDWRAPGCTLPKGGEGCSFDGRCAPPPEVDAGIPDSGITPDSGTPDSGVIPDAGTPDAGTADAGQTDAGVQPECTKDSDCPASAESCRAPKCELNKCEYPAVREGMSCETDTKDCTLDVCRGGNCRHEDISCGVGNECIEGKGCQPLPQCTKDADCPPTGEQCTINTCDAGKCAPHPKANGTACEDGLFCTVNDQCQNGQCLSGGARDCGVTNEPFSYMACDEGINACVKLTVDGCYGLEVVDPGPNAVSCTWWSAAGSNLGSFAPHDNVSTAGPDGACAVTCYDANGNDVSPQGCSGQWYAGHPQTWSAPGGQLTHGKGCTWDNKQQP